ncbi:hypothetical protein [Mucilaginibacter sp. CSA2-8R]|uniref:hypothetical protein n=1 Tax=Mucilaginibacter sp. CSA2-8R TaxID=3141542 RepID=UPI00315D2C22
MRNLIYSITIALFISSQFGCNNFEKKFYRAIEDGENRAIKTRNPTTFDLTSVTDFQWDSVLLIKGNESVPIFSEDIETSLHRKTTDLPVLRDRFYFLQHNKSLIVKEIKSSFNSNYPDYDLESCMIDSTHYREWLSRRECKFKLMTNSFTKGRGTIFLFPPCKTFIIPDSLFVN